MTEFLKEFPGSRNGENGGKLCNSCEIVNLLISYVCNCCSCLDGLVKHESLGEYVAIYWPVAKYFVQ